MGIKQWQKKKIQLPQLNMLHFSLMWGRLCVCVCSGVGEYTFIWAWLIECLLNHYRGWARPLTDWQTFALSHNDFAYLRLICDDDVERVGKGREEAEREGAERSGRRDGGRVYAMKQLRKLLQFSGFYFGIFCIYPVSQKRKGGLHLPFSKFNILYCQAGYRSKVI